MKITAAVMMRAKTIATVRAMTTITTAVMEQRTVMSKPRKSSTKTPREITILKIYTARKLDRAPMKIAPATTRRITRTFDELPHVYNYYSEDTRMSKLS
jgi:hypothetical protein